MLVLLLASILLSPSYAVPPSTAEIRGDASAQCPDQAAVHARVDRLLRGRDAGTLDAVDVQLSVRRVDSTYELTVETPGGTPSVMDTDCTRLADADALIGAIALDPSLVGSELDDQLDEPSAEEPKLGVPERDLESSQPQSRRPKVDDGVEPVPPSRVAASPVAGVDLGAAFGRLGGGVVGIVREVRTIDAPHPGLVDENAERHHGSETRGTEVTAPSTMVRCAGSGSSSVPR